MSRAVTEAGTETTVVTALGAPAIVRTAEGTDGGPRHPGSDRSPGARSDRRVSRRPHLRRRTLRGVPGAPGATGTAKRVTDRRATRWALGLALPALVLLAWHLVTADGLVAAYQLPAPADVWAAAADLAGRGQLWAHVNVSTQRVLAGFGGGALAGVVVGGLVGLSRIGEVVLTPTLAALRAVPSLAWVPLLILWLGIGEDARLTLIAIGAFFPVFTTLVTALRHVDAHLVEMGRTFGLRGLALLRTVQLPAVVPALVSGLRLGLAQAWLFLVAAEILASSSGLGWLLTDSQQTGRVDRILLAIVTLALLGTATNGLLGLAEKRLLRRWV